METRVGEVAVNYVEHGAGRPVLVLHGAGGRAAGERTDAVLDHALLLAVQGRTDCLQLPRRFLFGSEVVEASRVAFAEAPAEFPKYLSDALLAKTEEEHEPNRALVALEDAAKTTGSWVSSAAEKSTRVFRNVDLDGDGIPDEPQALTAAKGVGGAVAGAVSTGTRAFRNVDLDGDGIPDEPQVLTALKGAGVGVASRLKRKKTALDAAASLDLTHEPIEEQRSD